MNLKEWRERRRQAQTEEPAPAAAWIWRLVNQGTVDETIVLQNSATDGIALVLSRATYTLYLDHLNQDRQALSRTFYSSIVALHRVFCGMELAVGSPFIDARKTVWWKMPVAGYALYITGNSKYHLLVTGVPEHPKKVFTITGPRGWGTFVDALRNHDERTLRQRSYFTQ